LPSLAIVHEIAFVAIAGGPHLHALAVLAAGLEVASIARDTGRLTYAVREALLAIPGISSLQLGVEHLALAATRGMNRAGEHEQQQRSSDAIHERRVADGKQRSRFPGVPAADCASMNLQIVIATFGSGADTVIVIAPSALRNDDRASGAVDKASRSFGPIPDTHCCE